MARTRGARNESYEQKRTELIAKMRARLGHAGATHASWRELAAAAGVSLSTMSHYFGRRDDVVRAVMEDDFRRGAEPLATMATPSGDFASSIKAAVRHIADGFRYGGLSELFAIGLRESLSHPGLGPSFLSNILEPTLKAAESRLQAHIDAGEMQAAGPRGPAIALISPVVMAFLHQMELGGSDVRELDLDRFLDDHAAAFVRAYSTPQTPRLTGS